MHIVLPIIVLGLLGFIFGLWLFFAQKIFFVKKDSKIEEVFSLLPGSNCGACGKAGCYGLAEALVQADSEEIPCPVVHSKERSKIADLLGIEAQESVKRVAKTICGGGSRCKDKFLYHGPKDCNVASLLMNGPKGCDYGCIGFGSCAKACPFGAIDIGENSLPKVDSEKCTGCGKCLKACPKEVMDLVPSSSQYHVLCHSKDRGPDVMKACKVGCIGCGKCVKTCPSGAIILKDNLALIDYEKCAKCGECIKACPTKAIVRSDIR